MPELQGRRMDNEDGAHFRSAEARPGDYGFVDGRLWIVDPLGHVGSLLTHTITVHEDGTITVDPSIWDQATYGEDHEPGFHGWLRAGVWTWD